MSLDKNNDIEDNNIEKYGEVFYLDMDAISNEKSYTLAPRWDMY